MSKDDPFALEEARQNADLFLDRAAKGDDERQQLARAAFAVHLAFEQSRAARLKISSPAEREAMVANIITRIFEDYRSRKAP